MTKTELFLKLANPNKDGISRWVSISEFIGEYSDLTFGNGASWARKESTLAKKYVIEFDKSKTPGNSIDRIRLNGFNNDKFSQHIRSDIKKAIKSQRCVILGTSSPEVDHKNGILPLIKILFPKTCSYNETPTAQPDRSCICHL